MENKIYIPKLLIPVAESCNLNCSGCSNFSDYKFKGNVAYNSQYLHYLQEWFEKIVVGKLELYGGEPLIYPHIQDFLVEIRKYHKNHLSLITNATLWNRHKNLINFFKNDGNSLLRFSIHQFNNKIIESAIDEVLSIGSWEPLAFTKEATIIDFEENYNCCKGSTWPSYENFLKIDVNLFKTHPAFDEIYSFNFLDLLKNNRQAEQYNRNIKKYPVKIQFNKEYNFIFEITTHQKFTKSWQGNSYYDMKPFNSDPKKSYEFCAFYDCPVLQLDGRLYKCPALSTIKRVLTDHNLQDDKDWEPYINYRGVGINDPVEDLLQFKYNYDKAHDVYCKMCPTKEEADYADIDHYENVKNK